MASPTYYELLGVTPEASDAEVRGAFKRLARKYHPDKRSAELEKMSNPQNYDDHSASLAGTGANSYDEMFSLLANAYSVLGDNVKRAAYDIELSEGKRKGQRSVADSLRRLRALKKQDAELQSRLMEVTSEQRRENETKKGGLIFVEAWYGATYAIEHPYKHPNEVMNVTKQLQTMVENSKLILPKGDSKSAIIPGVFDPCPEISDKSLRVKYTFKGKQHHVTVRDDEMLMVPMKTHLQNGESSSSVKRSNDVMRDMSEEVKIMLAPGQGQLVHVKSSPRAKNSGRPRTRLGVAIRVVAIMGLISVIGSGIVQNDARWLKLANEVVLSRFAPALKA